MSSPFQSPSSDLHLPASRRSFLQGTTAGFGYLAFSALAAQQGRAAQGRAATGSHFPARAKRVIFLCMKGGPSHVDLLDHKPELIRRAGEESSLSRDAVGARLLAPSHEFLPSGQSGLPLTELFPHIAKHADDLCVINSMKTDLPNHAQAFGQMHTGTFQFVRPSLGAWTLYGLGYENENLPGFVTLNPPSDMGGAQNYGSAFLPAICQGTRIGGSQLPALFSAMTGQTQEPGPPMKHLDHPTFSRGFQRQQIDYLQSLNRRHQALAPEHQALEGSIKSMELAFRMQAEVPDTLDLAHEPEELRRRYGIGTEATDVFGRQCLLARRLAEAGVRFIEITAPEGWDHHRALKSSLEKCCAGVDQPIGALLSDLKARGMLEDTLVIWAGEFGRTPYAQSGDGRDHNHRGYSIWMAGGGVKGGHRHGATDDFGHRAVLDPVHIHDWHATILHLLGLDHKQLTYNYGGRDFRLTDVSGEVVSGILS